VGGGCCGREDVIVLSYLSSCFIGCRALFICQFLIRGGANFSCIFFKEFFIYSVEAGKSARGRST